MYKTYKSQSQGSILPSSSEIRTRFTVYRVEILHLKADYVAEDADSCDRELDRFLHYVSII
jgi:hypothetical protein